MIVDLLLWTFLGTFAVHILDETLMNGGFVAWIRDHFWPTYHASMFFWFNLGAIVAIAVSNIAWDLFGGHWIILALIWPIGFATHGVTVHIFWTVRRRTYSPGLVSSLLYWIILYLIIRYGVVAGSITGSDFIWGAIAGVIAVGGFLTVGPTLVFPGLVHARSRRG